MPQQESFLARRRFGPPNWLVIALVTCMCMGTLPRGIKQSILSNNNNAADWLPASYTESKELIWFRDHFLSSQFVLASWEGCTLEDDDKLRLLASHVRAATNEAGQSIFSQVLTGPEMVESLTRAPSNLSYEDAVDRLEGALVGPPHAWEAGEPPTRTTCIVAFLSNYSADKNLRMRAAVNTIERLANEVCSIPPEQLHLGGPPVDNITIDVEGEKTLQRLAVLSGLVGLTLAYWFFRSIPTTLAVFYVAGASAGASLAAVYYYGVFIERGLMGMSAPHLGTVDAILLSMPAVVYVLGLAGAIHLVNYYRDERDEHGVHGAVERAVRIAWAPCALAAFTTAVGLGSLAFSDIIPIMKFGGFTAAGVMITIGILFAVLPVFLHLFPPKLRGDNKPQAGHTTVLPAWALRYCDFVTTRHGLVTTACFAVMAAAALGLPRITTEVQLLKLLDPDVKLIHDYAWLEEHLGNLVPMEVVVNIAPKQMRHPDEPAEGDGVYRMTMYERMKLVERLERRMEVLPDVSRAMSAATFAPSEPDSASWTERRSREYTTSNALEENRNALEEYMRYEVGGEPGQPARELWRVSARVGALANIDYGQFVSELRDAVEPVLDAYRERDRLVAALEKDEKALQGSRVCIAYFNDQQDEYAEGSRAALLYELLQETRGPRGRAVPINLATLSAQLATADEATRDATLKSLRAFDAVIAVNAKAAEGLKQFAPDLAVVAPLPFNPHEPPHNERESPAFIKDQSLAAVYTGIVPLVYKTQRELLASLYESILWATVLIAGIMMLLFRNVPGGLISMIPNVFPVVVVFGMLGWLNVKVDIGIMMTASVALGVAVDDTIHFLTWFRRGIKEGMGRESAVRVAFERCSTAMMQTTLIAGLGLAVFSTSTFTPTQQFGVLMITILSAALVGDLVMLPALLCGPLGWFFAPKNPATPALDSPAHAPAPAPPKPEPAAEPLHITTPEIASEEESAAPDATPPSSRTLSNEPLSPSNAALHAKLKSLRRATND